MAMTLHSREEWRVVYTDGAGHQVVWYKATSQDDADSAVAVAHREGGWRNARVQSRLVWETEWAGPDDAEQDPLVWVPAQLAPNPPVAQPDMAGERVYFRWLWNSPDQPPVRPPTMYLEINDLTKGRNLRWVLSPFQAKWLAELALECVAEQQAQFGDAEPRDYDVREVP
jgi:hypothetical protein